MNIVRPTAARLCSSKSNKDVRVDTSILSNNRIRQGARRYVSQVAAEPFLNGNSSNYVEEMFFAWEKDPSSVHKVRNFNIGNYLL